MKRLLKRLSKKLFIGMIALIVIGTPLIYLTLLNSKPASASWYDDSWAYRQAITVTVTSSASDITNLETLVTVDTTGITAKVNTNCEDLRFTNQGGKLLPYYAPSCSDNSATNKVWVMLDLVPKNTTTYTLYMYYGNPAAPAVSDANKFNLFNGLVGYWNMNEASWNGTASEVKDSSVNTNHGVAACTGGGCTVPSTTASGKYSYGGSFDGSTQYFTVGDNNALDLSTAVTISFWYKRSASGVQTAVGKWVNSGNQQSYLLQVHTDNKIYWNISGTGSDGIYFTSTSAYTDTNWNHLVGVYNGTTLTVYLNGSTVAGSITGTVPSSIYNSTSAFENRYSGTNYYGGTLDDVRLYNRALSAAEASQLYTTPGNIASNVNATTKPSTSFAGEEKAPGPSAYWAFDEGQGTVAQDKTTNNNDGTLSGTTKPAWTTEDQCVSSKCLYFDGSSSYIDAGDPSNGSLDFGTGDFSVSTWVNPSAAGKVVVSKGANAGNAAGSKSGYMIYIDTDYTVWGEIASIDDNTLYYYFKTTNAISSSTWTHITMVRTSSIVKVYFNGVLQAGSNNGTGTASQITTVSTNASFRIGSYTPLGYYYQGYIDEVKVYPYARSATQVLTDYNSRGSVKGASVNLGNTAALDGAAPVGYWNFEEGSGTAANDTSSNANTGTLGGDGSGTDLPIWSTGKFGKGLKFDGSDDYVYKSVSNFQSNDNTGTMEAWIKTTGVGRIFTSSDEATDAYYIGALSYNNKLTIQTYDNSVQNLILGSTTIDDNKWHHIAVTSDGSQYQLYVDGIQQTLTVSSGSNDGKWFNDISNRDNISIGTMIRATGNPNDPFNGSIDDVKIYNYARTQKQIVSDMNAGHPSVGSPVGSALGHWKFDEGVDNTCSGGANDVCNSGNGGSVLDGANSGFASPATSTSGWTQSGKFGKALIFDGSNDYVSMSDNNIFSFTTGNSFTVSTWIYPAATPDDYDSIVGKWNNDAASTKEWLFRFNTGAAFEFRILDSDSNGNIGRKTTVTIPNTTWTHVVGTYDGSNSSTGVKIYINGIQRDTTNIDAGSFDGMNNTTAKLFLGALEATANSNFFNGQIDDARIYNYALTAEEVKLDYNRSSSLVLGSLSDNSTYQVSAANQEYCVPGDSTSCAAPVGRWDFEEGTGTSAFDKSGGGYNGSITGATYKPGKLGKALNFNAGTDVVDTISSISGIKSVSFWVKPSSTTGNFIDIQTAPGTINISASGGTVSATGFTLPTIYVNGVSAGTIVANTWNHVEVTTGTAVTGSAIRFGRISTTSLTGLVDSVRLFDYARTASQIAWDYNKGAPVAWYKMDECQGTTINDSAGNNLTGTLTIGTGAGTGHQDSAGTCTAADATTVWYNGRTGKRNNSINLDGIDDMVSITDATSSPLDLNTMTLAAWIYIGSTASDRVIMHKVNAYGLNLAYSAGGVGGTTGKIGFHRFAGASWSTVNSTSNQPLNSWVFVVGTYDGATSKIYINGNLEASVDNSTATGVNNNALTLGYNSAAGMAGLLDDVSVFNYALTPTQIKTLYNNGAVNFGPASGSP